MLFIFSCTFTPSFGDFSLFVKIGLGNSTVYELPTRVLLTRHIPKRLQERKMSSRFFRVVFSSPIVVSICIYGVSSPLPPLSPLRPPNQPGHAQRCNTHAYHGDHPLSETGCIRGGVENKRPECIQDIVPHTERITW